MMDLLLLGSHFLILSIRMSLTIDVISEGNFTCTHSAIFIPSKNVRIKSNLNRNLI